ncbi:MAG: type II secretion system protein [Phycisphaerales bacterium]|nr:MAG: type II secretion system protein [Phycisphaerales bacterium]
MKSCKHKCGLTLVEMLVVVAIIALLATMVIDVAARLDSKAKERLAENTLAVLTAALEQFHDYGYSYPAPFSEFEFPLDCNGFSVDMVQTTLATALGAGSVVISGGTHDPSYSGSAVLYFLLSRVPECKNTLQSIDRSLVTHEDALGNRMRIVVDGREYPWARIVDPWFVRAEGSRTGKALRYDCYTETVIPPDPKETRNFPLVTFAGPDGRFDTADDIISRPGSR